MKKNEKMRDRTPSNEEVYRMIDLCIDKELQYTLNREYDKANYYKRKKEMYKDLLRITP